MLSLDSIHRNARNKGKQTLSIIAFWLLRPCVSCIETTHEACVVCVGFTMF